MNGYSASALLTAGGLSPAEACAACGLPDADLVPVRPAPRWLERIWIGPVGAMTLPWAIYLRSDLLGADPPVLGRLVLHELAHVGQWRRHGPVRFLKSYLAGYLSARRRGLSHADAYRSIPFEAEARAIAGT